MKLPRLVSLLLVAALLAGCTYSRRIQRRSDLMGYLYPGADAAPATNPSGVTLQLPLKLGIAFVPGVATETRCGRCPDRRPVPAASEKKLLDIVKSAFQGRDWVSQIVMIPSVYLRPGGGFENLRQAARMHGVDVVALVSVDQLQSSHPEKISFLYLSVVGAYLLPLDHHDTQTLIDAAVFHVPSETFLLRAPGLSTVKGRAAAVDVDRDLEARSGTGLKLAMEDLSKNLDVEVEQFKSQVVSGERKDIDIRTVLLGLVAAKAVLEASSLSLFPHDGYFVVPLAHQAGALMGLGGAAVSAAVGAASRGARHVLATD